MCVCVSVSVSLSLCEPDYESCEWVMLPLILWLGSHPLHRHTASLCVAMATAHTIKRTGNSPPLSHKLCLSYASLKRNKCTHTHTHTHTHTLTLSEGSEITHTHTHLHCFCVHLDTLTCTKTAAQITLLRHNLVTGLYDHLSHAGTPAVLTYQEIGHFIEIFTNHISVDYHIQPQPIRTLDIEN